MVALEMGRGYAGGGGGQGGGCCLNRGEERQMGPLLVMVGFLLAVAVYSIVQFTGHCFFRPVSFPLLYPSHTLWAALLAPVRINTAVFTDHDDLVAEFKVKGCGVAGGTNWTSKVYFML